MPERLKLYLVVLALFLSACRIAGVADSAMGEVNATQSQAADVQEVPSEPPFVSGDWYSGDPHIHDFGCGLAFSPGALFEMMGQADLDVGSALVWGQSFEADEGQFTGEDWRGSTDERILHFDLEVSAFPSDLMGHFIPLNLKSIDFPRRLYTLPIAEWARPQGAVTGFAHASEWIEPYAFPEPGMGTPPYELPIDLAFGLVDYVASEDFFSDNGKPLESVAFVWGSLLNAGFRLAIVGASDFPCLEQSVGAVRTWVLVEGGFSYENWVEGIRKGRTVVTQGGDDFLSFTVNEAVIGSQLNLEEGTASVTVDVEGALGSPGLVEILVNGEVVASQMVSSRTEQNFSLEIPLTQSSWIAARAPRVQTRAIYVLVGGQPIRASARDAQFWADYIENLVEQIESGEFLRQDIDPAEYENEMREAIPCYLEARDIFAQRAAEARSRTVVLGTPQALFASKDCDTLLY